MLLELSKDKITLAATDTRRLAVFEIPCRIQGAEQPDNPAPVIPTKALSLIERSIPDAESEALLAIHAERGAGQSRQLDDLQPAGRRPVSEIPRRDSRQGRRHRSTWSSGPFYSAIRQAQIVTEEDSRGVDFRSASGLLTLTSKSADVGQSVIQLADQLRRRRAGHFVRSAVHRRLSSACSSRRRQIRLELIDAESAAVFRTDDAYTYVVMPLSRDR